MNNLFVVVYLFGMVTTIFASISFLDSREDEAKFWSYAMLFFWAWPLVVLIKLCIFIRRKNRD